MKKLEGEYQGTCAIVEGTSCSSHLFCWGSSATGGGSSTSGTPQCMNLDNLATQSLNRYASKSFSGSASSLYVTDISGGWNHYCAVLSNDQVACFGANNENVNTETPSTIPGGVASVHCGSYSACVLPKGFNGPPICWGYDANFAGTPSFNPIYASNHGYFFCFGGPNGETKCGGQGASSHSISIPNPFAFRDYLGSTPSG